MHPKSFVSNFWGAVHSPRGERTATSPSPVSTKRETGEGYFCGQHRSPIPTFPKGKERHSNALKHSK